LHAFRILGRFIVFPYGIVVLPFLSPKFVNWDESKEKGGKYKEGIQENKDGKKQFYV
jgi:hypothetical protein